MLRAVHHLKLANLEWSQDVSTKSNKKRARAEVDDVGDVNAIFYRKRSEDSFKGRMKELKKFKSKYGHCNVLCSGKTNLSLYTWCQTIRRSYALDVTGTSKKATTPKLTKERVQELLDIGFHFNIRPPCKKMNLVQEKESNDAFNLRIKELQQYKQHHGHCNVQKLHNYPLYDWCTKIRKYYQYFLRGLGRKVEGYAFTEERILALKQIGLLPHSASITEEEGEVLIEEEGPPNETTHVIANSQPIHPDAIKHDKKIAASFTYRGVTLAIEDDSDSDDGMESYRYPKQTLINIEAEGE